MLAAITCYFNPIEYDNILRNYWMFREDLKGVDLHTIELSFNGNFEIDDAIHVEGTPKHIMWQKERLLNLLIEKLPAKYDNIAWLDADILFNNPHWAAQTENKLKRWPMLQLFEHGLDTNSKLEPIAKTPGIVYERTAKENHFGLAWAARREILEKTPLLDTYIMGGGKNMIYHAAMGEFNNNMIAKVNIEWRRSYLKWAAKFYQEVQGKLGYVVGDLIHLNHGTYADRHYAERWMVLSQRNYDPGTDIRVNENGILEWASRKPGLHQAVAEYFEERKDDEIWISKMKEIVE